ncbi:MAG: iron-sulfur cluster repair di-iron protein [Porphyromonas sp.]|nr:iron-sulfur cluster repair di-iron protein [Porphyromonas sp.]
MKIDKNVTTVGEIAALNFGYTDVMNNHGIDFCCNGQDTLQRASDKVGADPDAVIRDLEAYQEKGGQGAIPFTTFPKDLLIDYILKIHHRGIRIEGPKIRALFEKVIKVHGDKHPELHEVRALFAQTLMALESHLTKEEQMLFPHLYQQIANLYNNRPWEAFHCGTVEGPISVMEHEHGEEGVRAHKMIDLTDHFTPPADACESFKLLYRMLHDFIHGLFEHIHLENNILFPWAIAAEKEKMGIE